MNFDVGAQNRLLCIQVTKSYGNCKAYIIYTYCVPYLECGNKIYFALILYYVMCTVDIGYNDQKILKRLIDLVFTT